MCCGAWWGGVWLDVQWHTRPCCDNALCSLTGPDRPHHSPQPGFTSNVPQWHCRWRPELRAVCVICWFVDMNTYLPVHLQIKRHNHHFTSRSSTHFLFIIVASLHLIYLSFVRGKLCRCIFVHAEQSKQNQWLKIKCSYFFRSHCWGPQGREYYVAAL